jgi:nitrate reductase gamma subunit
MSMPIEVSRFTAVLMDQVQLVALAFMAVVYLVKVRWIASFRASAERTPARGSHAAGIRYAYATLAMPWELPSTRVHWFRWVEFAVFHVAVAAAIGLTFVMPYWPAAVAGPLAVASMQVVFTLGATVAVSRLTRRFTRPEMRLITTPDDVFSLVLLTAWLAAGVLAAPQRSEAALVAFFGLTAFFLVYVPFSKISHYIYYPFIRYYIGKHFGHRGSYPPTTAARQA